LEALDYESLSLANKKDVDSIVSILEPLDIDLGNRPNLIHKVFSIIESQRFKDAVADDQSSAEDSQRFDMGFADEWKGPIIEVGDKEDSILDIVAIINPTSREAQRISAVMNVCINILLTLGAA
jgi:hypothetical protein